MYMKDLKELMNQLGKVSVEATMTCTEFLEALKKLSKAFHITEDEIFTDDEKIVIIPKGDTEKPIKLVFEPEENEALQTIFDKKGEYQIEFD